MLDLPINEAVTLADLTRDPYPIYKRMRAETPVVRMAQTNRILVTRAEHTKWIKETPEIFSSDDPTTPMKPAFQAQTLMRKDGAEHRAERMAMQPAFSPKVIRTDWADLYTRLAEDYVSRLPRGETVDLFRDLCGPIAARILAHMLGLDEASDEDMQRWSQTLIDGAGNFGYDPKLFELSDAANAEMNALFDSLISRHRAEPNNSAFSTMLNARNPIPMSQVYANLKIAIGGGINEPRDALATIVYGLLTNPDQFEEVKRQALWEDAFEEGVRWVAPIQVSGRRTTQEVQIGDVFVGPGEAVMTIQASANRDETIYGEDGELFNIFRDKHPHQAFGSGPHHCAGAQVARRTLGQIMLPLLFDRFPNMTLDDPAKVIWSGFGFRGPLNLPVTLN
ncbi:cytochrome P450 [Celeribacter ethanolicus]|uniref:cytochrome P450 n=1 Tax=Celeribacter ethanolicus TaxID=1758178 RepID=UPI0008311924|nr:cytochrome P450 [Celeribacter ethanolicus]TNE63168.1 MAG: cytochrome P450 [Paracoccaceae bacterium]